MLILQRLYFESLTAINKYIILLFIFSIPVALIAQEEETSVSPNSTEVASLPKNYYVLSPRVSVTVPHPMGNKSFKKSFVGIYEVSGGLNVYLIKGAFMGLTYKNGLLKITENKISDYNASLYINNAAVKIGGDFFVDDKNRVIYSMAISAGRSWASYHGLVAKDPTKVIPTTYTCTYFEPEMNLFFLIESNFGIGATLSYSVFNKNFDPYELSLNDWAQFGKNNSGKTQYLSFGFGFYYSLWRKKGIHKGGN